MAWAGPDQAQASIGLARLGLVIQLIKTGQPRARSGRKFTGSGWAGP